jgi:hypothetical protein
VTQQTGTLSGSGATRGRNVSCGSENSELKVNDVTAEDLACFVQRQ